MKKLSFLKFSILLVGISLFITSCSSDDGPDPDPKAAWSVTMAGNDPEEIAWPDQSENYWEYTLDITKYPNVGLRFKGEYPTTNTRFFNFTLYDDNTTLRIGSIEDFNIKPNSGSSNPFDASASDNAGTKNYFEVNAVPAGTSASVKSKLQNVLEFPSTTKNLSVLLRIYFNSTNHDTGFGGVDLPGVYFINLDTGEEIGAAVRGESLYHSKIELITKAIPQIQPQKYMVFTLAPDLLYSNGPTGYVTSANRLRPDSVLLFRFIPPVHPTSIADNRTADVRYWSICVGDTLTNTPITVPDRQIEKSDDGYVNFMIIEKATEKYTEIVAKAKSMKINVITWDNKTYGEPLMVFYRQMYIKSGFEHSVKLIPPYPPLKNGLPDSSAPIEYTNMAHITLGEHGPCGMKLPAAYVLNGDFSYSNMRMPSF